MSKRLKLVMTACSLAGLTGGMLGLLIGVESVPPNAGLEAGAVIFVWFVGTGFALALLAGILGWLMREEFLGRLIKGLIGILIVVALVFGLWLWRRNRDQSPAPQASAEMHRIGRRFALQ